MVIGARGSVIGRIGIAAREELCTVLKKKVHLDLGVIYDSTLWQLDFISSMWLSCSNVRLGRQTWTAGVVGSLFVSLGCSASVSSMFCQSLACKWSIRSQWSATLCRVNKSCLRMACMHMSRLVHLCMHDSKDQLMVYRQILSRPYTEWAVLHVVVQLGLELFKTSAEHL